MLTNDTVRLISQLKNENRRLKSKQTIVGSTVKTGSSTISAMEVKIPSGSAGVDYYTVGELNIDLQPLDNTVDDPMVTFNVIATLSKTSPADVQQQAPQFPAGIGGFSFGWASSSINKQSAQIRFVLTHDYQMASQGQSVYLYLFSSGTSTVKSVQVNYRNITT